MTDGIRVRCPANPYPCEAIRVFQYTSRNKGGTGIAGPIVAVPHVNLSSSSILMKWNPRGA